MGRSFPNGPGGETSFGDRRLKRPTCPATATANGGFPGATALGITPPFPIISDFRGIRPPNGLNGHPRTSTDINRGGGPIPP